MQTQQSENQALVSCRPLAWMLDAEQERELEASACFLSFFFLERTSVQAPPGSSGLPDLEESAGSFRCVLYVSVSEVRVENVVAGRSSGLVSITESQGRGKPNSTAHNATLTTGDEVPEDQLQKSRSRLESPATYLQIHCITKSGAENAVTVRTVVVVLIPTRLKRKYLNKGSEIVQSRPLLSLIT